MRPRGIAAAEALRLVHPWYPATVPYASPLSNPPQLTDGDVAQVFFAMIAAATAQQVQTWAGLQTPGTASRDVELDKLSMDGAIFHQLQVREGITEAAAGVPDSYQGGSRLLADVSDNALAIIAEDGMPCPVQCCWDL